MERRADGYGTSTSHRPRGPIEPRVLEKSVRWLRWRLSIFLSIYSGLTVASQLVLWANPAFMRWVRSQPSGILTPASMFTFEGLELLILAIATSVMCLIERRSPGDLGPL